MGKTTNILDLNNRLERVEKENVAQNSYTSLKNKPKINGVTLTGNKSLADIGAAAAADLNTLAGDVGDVTNLTTTVKTDTVAAINEVDGKCNNLKYHKIAESESAGTYSQKLQSLATAYNALTREQKMTAMVAFNGINFYVTVNAAGDFFTVYIDATNYHIYRLNLNGSFYKLVNGTISDASSDVDTTIISLWISN